MKNIYYITILSLLLYSCKNIENVYGKEKLDSTNKSIQFVLEKFDAKEANQSVVYFTSWFENDTVQMINGKDTIMNRILKTVPQLSLTAVERVLNDKKIEIIIKAEIPLKIVINQKKLKQYKFLYITRDAFKRGKFILEYSNNDKNFY